MRSSSHLLAPGFLSRSLDEIKRFAKIGMASIFCWLSVGWNRRSRSTVAVAPIADLIHRS